MAFSPRMAAVIAAANRACRTSPHPLRRYSAAQRIRRTMLTPNIQHPHTSRLPDQSLRQQPRVQLQRIRTSFVLHPIDGVNHNGTSNHDAHGYTQNFSSDLHFSHRFQESEQSQSQTAHRNQELPKRFASEKSFLHPLYHTPKNDQKEQSTEANHGTETSRFDDRNQIFVVVIHDVYHQCFDDEIIQTFVCLVKRHMPYVSKNAFRAATSSDRSVSSGVKRNVLANPSRFTI
nr:MAG TPA: hypothetical protein [Caudoviricetes sp.]